MKIEKILLPVDGSEYSANATSHALYLAKLCSADITAVSCYEWHGNFPEVPEMLVSDLKAKIKKEAEGHLRKVEKVLEGQGVAYTLETISGAPSEVLPRLAKSKEYDLIIMGSQGHSDIAGLFLGSVTHKVLSRIYCPVLVVP